jgi:uncharacterized protein YbaA (DUF1428 family)
MVRRASSAAPPPANGSTSRRRESRPARVEPGGRRYRDAMKYVDGFLLVVPKKQLAAYVTMSKKVGKVWKEHGALEYRECVGDDLRKRIGVPFGKRAAAKKGDLVVFSWIVYRSRAHRDRVNKAVMADPRLAGMCGGPMPFDVAKMSYGGFQVCVDA